MNKWIKWIRMTIPVLVASLVVFFAGCSGGSSSPDVCQVNCDGDGDDGEKTVLCTNSQECPQGMECRGGVCQSSQTCNCNYDCDKSINERCNQATNQCETGAPPVNCESDCDCYTGERCISSQCVASGGDETTCTQDDECPEAQVCEGGRCTPKVCTTRVECEDPVCLVCEDGECVPPPPICQGNEDCCIGFHCNFGGCDSDIPDGCQSDAECLDLDFPRCKDRDCVPECLTAIDCPLPGQICENTHCVTPGCTPEDCPQGQWCDTGDGQCKPGCDSNADCTPPATCNYVEHACGMTDCCGGCEDTHYCETLTCQCAEKCSSDTDCPTGFQCNADGTCWCINDQSCPGGTHCDLGTGRCVQDTIECTSDTDCPAGWTCNLGTGLCESQGGQGEGSLCFQDDMCDMAGGLYCDNCFVCAIAILFGVEFIPTFTCRKQCGLFVPCSAQDRECLLRRVAEPFFVCMPLP